MGERHVEDLFSAAYDGALSERERARFDEHMAGCQQCAAGQRDFRAAVDAVRALPPARMPVRVVLPATPPVAERRSLLPPFLKRLRLPGPGPALSAGMLAAAGIAVVVVAVHGHGGSTAAGSSVAFSNLSPLAKSAAGAGTSQHGSSNNATTGNCIKPVLTTTLHAAATAGTPTGFANRVSVGVPQRPGQELVLATTSGRYTPGSQVLVYAALTTSSGQRKAVVPCVTLRGPQFAVQQGMAAAGAPAAPATPIPTAVGGGGSTSSSASSGMMAQEYDSAFAPDNSALSLVGEVPLAFATTTTQSVGALPVQAVTIPATVPPGSQLHLVAIIPAGVPGASDQGPVEAVLTLDVS